MKKLLAVVVCAALSACGTPEGGVANKVLTDFGIRAPGDDYVQPSDRVFERLDTVGRAEMKRMNYAGRSGETKFQDEGQLRGQYYKEVKVYENYYPLDAQKLTRSSQSSDRGYVGYIAYEYRIMQSERFPTRVEAENASTTVRSSQTGRETYRYSFGPGGEWNGGAGQLTKQ